MSQETLATLNTQTLIGFTSKRGNAWHYSAEEQGTESNHYEFAIPVDDVTRRLFNWQAVEGELSATAFTNDGVIVSDASEFKPIIRSDNGYLLGIFKQGYQAHQYEEWLVTHVKNILDADLHIGSAGLLRNGRQAWVQIEMEETAMAGGTRGIEVVEHRPFLTAASSLDGSLSSTYLTGTKVVVCDNTLSVALTERDHRVKIKHSRNSLGRVQEVRDALGLVHTIADQFAAQVEELGSQFVSDSKWAEFVKAYTFPGTSPSARSMNSAARTAGQLNQLWNTDLRVAPWKGSAYGVLAAVNTYVHHTQNVKGDRTQRNAAKTIEGGFDTLDAKTLDMLARV